jgi:hypothetical protein
MVGNAAGIIGLQASVYGGFPVNGKTNFVKVGGLHAGPFACSQNN